MLIPILHRDDYGGKMPIIDLKALGEKTLTGARNIFSLRNLTVSLISALLVIGTSYLTGVVGTYIQPKAMSNQTIYIIYFIVTIIVYLIAIVGPAFLAAVYKKDWASFMYIVILGVVWLSIFIAVLYFTTPTEPINPLQLMSQ